MVRNQLETSDLKMKLFCMITKNGELFTRRPFCWGNKRNKFLNYFWLTPQVNLDFLAIFNSFKNKIKFIRYVNCIKTES